MNSRERVRAILQGKQPDRIPIDCWFVPEVYDKLSAHTGATNERELYEKLDLDRIIWVPTHYNGPVRPEEREDQVTNFWGMVYRRVQSGVATYLEYESFPLENVSSVDELDEYEWWPDLDQFDYEKMAADTKAWSDSYATLGPWVSFFEIYCAMRGLQNAMIDVLADPEFVENTLDRIEAVVTGLYERYIPLVRNDLDMLFLSDDMGTQQSLLLSQETWQEHIAPRTKRICDLAHKHGLKVVYHSDGAVRPLLNGLIECGIDVLNPIQHLCPGMEMEALKRDFGDRLIFYGGVDTQNALPFGSVEDVRKETQRCLEALGADGKGYICCSCHNVQADTPVENVITMIETAKEFGPTLVRS